MADEMQTDTASANVPTTQEASAVTSATAVEQTFSEIIALIERSTKSRDTRLQGRLLRHTAVLRKRLAPEDVSAYVRTYLPHDSATRAFLTSQLEQVASSSAMQTGDSPNVVAAPEKPTSTLPETEMYAYVLALVYLCDNKMWPTAKTVADAAVERLGVFNRRTLDLIGARVYFYYSLAYEHSGQLDTIRSSLLALHRTAVLRHDALGQETLTNLLLRNYLHYSLYDQAEKFRSKAHKSEAWRSPPQYCRYLWYLGRIRTIQLEYSEAKDCLQQAVRKAPTVAHGFRICASKWLILVRLLLGEIPERSEFALPGMFAALQPYFQLALAVKGGDLLTFAQVAAQYLPVFQEDRVASLITRLHHNVLRTGLRRINLAYSRISLADVASKLHLASAEDAECIVAKAIRDGAIQARLDHDGGFMSSSERRDVYSTPEPLTAFHARVAFCLDLHNDAVKAMRYDPDAHKKHANEDAAARAERLKEEEELARALEEEDADAF